MKSEKILVIYGTNRKNSLTRQVGDYYTYLLKKENIEPDILNLVDLPSDFTKSALYENNGKNKTINKFKQQINDALKIVIIVPEYNGSFPGVLKAFIDALEFPQTFQKKKIAFVGVSRGPRGCFAGINHLTYMMNYLGAYVYPFKLYLSGIPKEDIKEVLKIEKYDDLLQKHAKEIVTIF